MYSNGFRILINGFIILIILINWFRILTPIDLAFWHIGRDLSSRWPGPYSGQEIRLELGLGFYRAQYAL